MRWIWGILLVLMAALQYRLWLGHGGIVELNRLEAAVYQQKQENQRLRQRNNALEAEVRDLKTGLGAVEARARSELGMIRDGETFFQVVEEP